MLGPLRTTLTYKGAAMSFHNEYDKWAKMIDPANCPVCQAAPMPDGMIDLAELTHSWLNAEPVECIKGACHVTSKYHGIEIYDLNDEELSGLMKDVALYAKALKLVTGAEKINYEIHGNSLPHLHIHLYPRYLDDPFPNQPIDYRLKKADIYQGDEFQNFQDKMRIEIEKGRREWTSRWDRMCAIRRSWS
jgi:diadenosine tetraphosphate (Ap4A) HIT family hydrolase